MERRGCAGAARPDRLLGDQAAIELRIVGRRHVGRRRAGIDAAWRTAARPSRRPRPATAKRPALARRCAASACAASTCALASVRRRAPWPATRTSPPAARRCGPAPSPACAPPSSRPADSRRTRRAGACPRADRPAPAPARPRRPRAPGRSRACGRPPARACARPVRSSAAGKPSRHSGCLSSAISATGSKRRAAASIDEIEERAGRSLGERLASRSRRPAGPTPRAGRRRAAPAARSGVTSAAVRPGALGHLAQDQRDRPPPRPRRSRASRMADARQRLRHLALVGLGDEAMPALGGAGRAHGLAHEAARALRSAARGRRAGQRQHVLAPHLERIEQLLEAELRMLGMRRARSPASSPRRATGRAPAAPARRSAGCATTAQQLRHRRHAAHHAGDDHRRVGRRLAASARACASTSALSCCHLGDGLALGQVRRPVARSRSCRNSSVLSQCSANVSGTSVRMRSTVDVLDLHRIHQAGELARQPGGLRRRARGRRRVGGDVGLGPAAAALGLATTAAPAWRAPAGARSRRSAGPARPRRRRRGPARSASRLGSSPEPMIGLILGSSSAAPLRRLQERLLQRPRRAPRRQQQRDVGELQRAGPRARRARADCRPAAPPPAPSGTAGPAAPCRCAAPAARPRSLVFLSVSKSTAQAPLRFRQRLRCARRASTRLPCARRRRGRRRSPGSTPR